MSTATAAEAAVPAKPGKKKWVLIAVLAVVLLLAAAGGSAVLLMKKNAQAEAEDEGDGAAGPQAHGAAARDPKVVPVFVPLDTFTVLLSSVTSNPDELPPIRCIPAGTSVWRRGPRPALRPVASTVTSWPS